MQSEDRLIHFSTELIHPPMRHKVPDLQKLYYDLTQTCAAYDSVDFSTPQYRFYSRRPPNIQSVALFMPDRTVLIEEWADMPFSGFLEKVREVGLRAISVLNIPFFAAQTATLRSTFALSHFEDARIFLIDHACGQADRIGPYFRRPVAVGGLRFVLPETPDYPGTYHILIESFRHNSREIFVEVKTVFTNLRIDPENIMTATHNVVAARNFITKSIYPYLEQFDIPQEETM